SYALCLAEILDEVRRLGVRPTTVYVAAAGATGAGLALGRVVLGLPWRVKVGCPIRWPWDVCAGMGQGADHAAELLDLPHRLTASDIDATEDYIGPAYGIVTLEGRAALDLMARREGILLDPVYTAKAMAALIDDVRAKRIAPGEAVVFLHTGGTP